MREKRFCVIMTFPSTTDAMGMEQYCREHDVPGRLIPVPTVISAGCGLCWSAPAQQRQAVEPAGTAAGIRVEGVYEMLL